MLRKLLPTADLVLFYITCVRSVLGHAVPVFHSLPKYLIDELEGIQKRAMAISFPGCYNNAINIANIPRLEDHHKNICKLFNEINNNKDHVFYMS